MGTEMSSADWSFILYLMIHDCVVCVLKEADSSSAYCHTSCYMHTETASYKCVNKQLLIICLCLFFNIRVHQVRASGPDEPILYMQVNAVRKDEWFEVNCF